jgi:hypothetical protein
VSNRKGRASRANQTRLQRNRVWRRLPSAFASWRECRQCSCIRICRNRDLEPYLCASVLRAAAILGAEDVSLLTYAGVGIPRGIFGLLIQAMKLFSRLSQRHISYAMVCEMQSSRRLPGGRKFLRSRTFSRGGARRIKRRTRNTLQLMGRTASQKSLGMHIQLDGLLQPRFHRAIEKQIHASFVW